MKNRNHKIFLATIALAVNTTFVISPFTTITYADTVIQTQGKSIDVKLDSKNNTNLTNNNFTLTNKGESLDLSKVKLRYYFTSDESSNGQDFACYYSALSGLNNKYSNLTEHVHGNFVKLDTPIENADSYLEISFDEKSGSFDSSDVLTLNTAINNKTWSKINSDDDYSFNDATKTVVLIDDEVVSGTSPISKEETIPKITLGGVTVKGGETVNVPINISNIKKTGISKFHIKVAYDPDIFEFDNAFIHNPEINKLGYNVKTGKWHNQNEHTADIGYDFTKAENTKALYEEGDYVYIPLKAKNSLENGISYLKVIVEPTLTDASGKEYSGDTIAIDNKPITLKYNKDVVKDSLIDTNYLTFDENSIKDTSITMKKYENEVTNIQCTAEEYWDDSDSITLNPDTDFEISDNILTLKESFLKTLLGKNSYITINYDKGLSQTIFVNNTDFDSTSDPIRSVISNNEANISIAKPEYFGVDKSYPLTFAITNTSNTNMDLGKLNLKYYYEKENARVMDDFKLDYCSILNSNKDIRSLCKSESNPLYCDWYYNKKCCLTESFDEDTGVLKPGETLLFRGYFTTKGEDTIRNDLQEPVVTYDGESIYGDLPNQYKRDSKIISDTIKLDSTEADIPVELQLNSNTLTSIVAYSDGTLVKTLKEGTDYKLNKRNEVILTKSYLNSISENTTLDFKFSYGHDDTIDIKCFEYGSTLPNGSLRIENAASIGYGETGYCGGPYSAKWDDLIVPITLSDSLDEEVTNYSITLKFNKYLFDSVRVESFASYNSWDYDVISDAEVNYDLGIIKISLSPNLFKTSKDVDFNIIFTPNGNTDPQKIDLYLDDDSYYETESGDRYKPVFNYNDIELVSRNESRYDSNN